MTSANISDRKMFWCVAQTEPQRERFAVEQLGYLGYETYFPRVRFKKLGKWRTSPLFPSYLFLRRADDQFWTARWAMGVVSLLMSGDRPSRLSDDIINEIQKKEVNGFVKLRSRPKMKRGQYVRITGGRFDGHIAIYEGQSGHERERVLLELLGRMVPVELGYSDRVEALDIVASAR
jgi:transcription antitermination factor NusG